MFTFISISLIVIIFVFFLYFKRAKIFKIIYKFFYLRKEVNNARKNDFSKLKTKNKIKYQNDKNSYSNLERSYLKKQMTQLFKGSKEDKLEALNIAKKLADKSTLNILRVGLKDMDSDIVKLSAKLIANFK